MILQGPYRPDLLAAETLPDILEATILRHPAAVAIQWLDQSLTYDTLGPVSYTHLTLPTILLV